MAERVIAVDGGEIAAKVRGDYRLTEILVLTGRKILGFCQGFLADNPQMRTACSDRWKS